MSKRVIGFLGLAMLFALVAYASDPWKEKDFKDWDQNDVKKILTDSPWVKPVQIGGGGSAAPGSALTPTGDAAHRDQTSVAGDSGGSGGGGSAAMMFTVSWASARTFREALARNKELNGTPAEEARKNLGATQETFIILVRGNNLGGFDKLGEVGLKEKAYLMGKKSKEKVSATRVILQKGPDGKRSTAIIFEFPKKAASGSDVIGAEEKSVEFFTPGGNAELKVGFDLTKMADKTGSDW